MANHVAVQCFGECLKHPRHTKRDVFLGQKRDNDRFIEALVGQVGVLDMLAHLVIINLHLGNTSQVHKLIHPGEISVTFIDIH